MNCEQVKAEVPDYLANSLSQESQCRHSVASCDVRSLPPGIGDAAIRMDSSGCT